METDNNRIIALRVGRLEYTTSASILSAQSSYLRTRLELEPDAASIDLALEDDVKVLGNLPVVDRPAVFHDRYLAYILVLDNVALPPQTSVSKVLAYTFPNSLFGDGRWEHYAKMWRLMHQWGLDVMIERFKAEIYRRLYKSEFITGTALIRMENAVQPADEAFFRSCAGLILARRMFAGGLGLRATALNEVWDETKSAIWKKHGDDLRKVITAAVSMDRTNEEYWTRTFPINAVAIQRRECEPMQLQLPGQSGGPA